MTMDIITWNGLLRRSCPDTLGSLLPGKGIEKTDGETSSVIIHMHNRLHFLPLLYSAFEYSCYQTRYEPGCSEAYRHGVPHLRCDSHNLVSSMSHKGT
jgi:hypothetical protein